MSEGNQFNMEGKDRKVFNDPIHGTIELHPLCVKIIDTPQFQRLRFIKQLGGVYFVYPGAAHNRFEHSIGVCHLAGRLVRALRDQILKSKELNDSEAITDIEITPVDELCVEVAALCHDLGHGPFSHLFDKSIIPWFQKDLPKEEKRWKHEQGSVIMLQYMIDENAELKRAFEANLDKSDLVFIKELINGPQEITDEEFSKKEKEKYEVRKEKKGFLYEIVSNKRNGIDVDKWDYFARDCYMLGIGNNFNHDRCIAFSRVIDVKGERQICYRNKEASNLYDMFHTRYLLHTRAYQHKTNNIIEYMIAEALKLANDFLTYPGVKGDCKMSETINDMKAFTLLNDGVINRIIESESTEESVVKSKKILQRVLSRNLYKFVGQERFDPNKFIDENKVREDMGCGPGPDDIVIDIVHFNYGKKEMNPIEFVNFFSKESPNKAGPRKKDDVSLLLPQQFAEQLVRVYCKEQKSFDSVKNRFDEWSKKIQRRSNKKPKLSSN